MVKALEALIYKGLEAQRHLQKSISVRIRNPLL